MQMVKNIVIFLILLPLVAIVMSPKKELYFLLEQRLQQQNIVISGEELDEGFFGLTVKHPIVYFGGAEVASADEVSLWSLLLYTQADINSLKVAEGMPTEVTLGEIKATHSILSPLNIAVVATSSLGSIDGKIATVEKKIHLDIAQDGDVGVFAKYLQKNEKGWYYESKF